MHVHFITGRLAERALNDVLQELAPRAGFTYTIQTLNITVAALMTPEWIAKRIDVPTIADKILIPGYCEGDPVPIALAAKVPVERGPRDLRRLPEYFGRKPADDDDNYDIEIVAEINHAPKLTPETILNTARRMKADGADFIDLGCIPGAIWKSVGAVVRMLRDDGIKVSIDSLEPSEIFPAVHAGAELVLSVNSSNREAAVDWGCEVVVIPDTPDDLNSLDDTIEFLAARNVRMRIDPILEPIGMGFAASLNRYFVTRRRYPDAELFMGIGNLTELTDADSAAINVLLLGYCQELGIRGVLTTQVVNWARNSVRECDLARRLTSFAVRKQTIPKHREPRLIPLRGDAPRAFDKGTLEKLAADIRDTNYRVFAADERIHLAWSEKMLSGEDPFRIFADLLATAPKNMDAAHAFYLGYEMCKAATALTLHKHYEQDEALDWGYLTRPETRHRLTREDQAE